MVGKINKVKQVPTSMPQVSTKPSPKRLAAPAPLANIPACKRPSLFCTRACTLSVRADVTQASTLISTV